MINWQQKDPNIARETAVYDDPIPSRQFILQTLTKHKRPLSHAELTQIFTLSNSQQIEALRRRLRAMERDGQLLFTRNKTYALVDKLQLIRGVVSAKRDGVGFVLAQNEDPDLFLNAKQMRQVFDGDEVLVQKIQHKNNKPEANIVEVINRAHPFIIGRCEIIDGLGIITPESAKLNQQILLESRQDLTALNGKIVKVAISKWPTMRLQAIGAVIEVLGDYLDKGLEIDIALHNHNIPYLWSDEALKEATQSPQKISTQEQAQRLDLSDLPFVTIDGIDAKDFDDAVFCRQNKRGWQLYVAIADVSYYVKPNSELDLEAAKRGNSVYFPNLVVPMLPEQLSNDLCSLKPNVLRLALVCMMQISKNGNLLEFKFAQSIIKSCARLTYDQVALFLQNNEQSAQLGANFLQITPSLIELHKLFQVLQKARIKRGALDFDTRETIIKLDDNGKIKAIKPVVRNDAHRLIEECMLLANVAAATLVQDLQIPSLYRIHDEPLPDKITTLKAFLAPFSLSLMQKGKSKIPTPKDYQQLLTSIHNRPDAHIIQTMLLRSLSQAVYSTKVSQHFGLNFKAYTHFTSPIRRYPDLLVHRAICAVINSDLVTGKVMRIISKPHNNDYVYTLEQLQTLANHCSQTERRADEATREVTKWLKCEYMKQHLGATFSGVISAVTNFGIFVELADIFIEGLVHISSLPSDYYYFDNVNQTLIGEHSGRKFKLGDKVTIQVARVELTERKIDFLLKNSSSSKTLKSSKSKKQRKSK